MAPPSRPEAKFIMTRIYLVRHAESIANTQGAYQGQTHDTSLSSLGLMQSRALADYLKDHYFDRIIVSPLKRAMQTAHLIAKAQNLDPVHERRIIEINHGKWEGLSKLEVSQRWPQAYLLWQKFPSKAVFPGGERFLDTSTRVVSWWRELSLENGIFLVITHDGIIRLLLAQLTRQSLDSIWQFNIQPASISIIENGRINTINHTSHLTGLLADLSLHAL